MLKVWNMFLVITAFLLTIMGPSSREAGSSPPSTHSRRARSAPGSRLPDVSDARIDRLLIWRRPLLKSENTLDSFVRGGGFLLIT